ncbi:MAG: chitobiase/beta-hexosaminidase C-terminal domain-containing protein [Verrucomicrobiales bacterium]|nr:chitobiase/beta-hexosaminidase C-terminal domain-containing protein [Verrucomicrobiales bacterium]
MEPTKVSRWRAGEVVVLGLVLWTWIAGASAMGAVLPASGDLWDVRQGVRVLESSRVRAGFDVRDLLGGNGSTAERGATVFGDPTQAGTVHFVEWETPGVVTVRSVALFAVGDGAAFSNQREMGRFRLLTKSEGSGDFNVVMVDFQPAHPYAFADASSLALLATNLPGMSARVFRAEFVGWDGGTGERGPRIVELDAYDTSFPAVFISPPGGAIDRLTEVHVGVSDPDLTIHYTMDGSEPTAESTIYDRPFVVRSSVVVKARGFAGERAVTEIVQAEYVAPEGCVTAPMGLIRWWTGERSRNEVMHDGETAGTSSDQFEPGMVGEAFSFSREAPGFSAPDAPDLHLQEFTVEAWVKFPNGSGGTPTGLIFGYPEGGYGVGILSDGRMFLSEVGRGHVASDFIVRGSDWHHLAVTCRSGRVNFFLDGEPDPAKDYTVTFAFNGSPAVGAPNVGNSLFTGAVDELCLYNRELGEDEIRAVTFASDRGKCRLPQARIEQGSRSFSEPFVVTLLPLSAEGVLRYTVDGTDPSTNSPIYSVSIPIRNTQTLKAQFFHSSGLRTAIATAHYQRQLPSGCLAPMGLVRWFPGDGDVPELVVGAKVVETKDVQRVPGVRGEAYGFDGVESAVESPPFDGLRLRDFSIEGWVRRADLGAVTHGVSRHAALISLSGEGYDLGMLPDGRLALSRFTSHAETTRLAIVDLNWHHVAVSKRGAEVVFFVDGKSEVTDDHNEGFEFVPSTTLGSAHSGMFGPFWGSLDEVGIYDRALAADDFGVLSQNGAAGKCDLGRVQTEPEGGSFPVSVAVILRSPVATGEIRYTLNGISPTKDSPVFESPIVLAETTTIRARVFVGEIAASLEGVAEFDVHALEVCAKPDGLVAWWTGDDGTRDAFGGHPGGSSASMGFTSGRVGRAFDLNGVDSALPIFRGQELASTDFSVEGWVRRQSETEATRGGSGNGIFFAYGDGGYGFGLFHDGRLFLTKVGIGYVASPPALVDLQWHHVAVTRSGSKVRFYLDGLRVSESNYDVEFDFSSDAAVGASPAGGAGFYGGIDELSVYRRALTEGEMRALFRAGSKGKCLDYPPAILAHPAGAGRNTGGKVTFAVGAVGPPPLAYQWLRDDQAIDGATETEIVITNIALADAGNYSVKVSNPYGTSISSSAALSVVRGPSLLQVPTAQTAFVGQSVTFRVTATGELPLSYQWLRNGVPISNASTPQLLLASVRVADAGNYSVLIINPGGQVASDPASLTVVSGRMTAVQELGGIRITVTGDSGFSYFIQRSPDLEQWESVATVLNAGSRWDYLDPIEPESPHRFYRLLLR